MKISSNHRHISFSYIYNEEIKPAPGIAEVRLESIGKPLENHLHHKYVSEHLVCILKDRLYELMLLQVDILKSLSVEHQDTIILAHILKQVYVFCVYIYIYLKKKRHVE